MLSTSLLCAAAAFALGSHASPAPQLLGGLVSDLTGSFSTILDDLESITATATPTGISGASATLSLILSATPTPSSLYDYIGDLVEEGLTSINVAEADAYLNVAGNSMSNANPRNPSPAAYPRAGKNDAPYDLSEQALRSAIYIPSTFQYGRKGAPQPVILVPGTGNTGYITYIGNYIPLLQGSNIGDPVWLNIPGYLLNDVQTNAEYVAYAINYIYGISNHRKPAVFSWSQGGVDAQWAFKYWPSTRSRVTDLVAFSPDFHGTVLANLIELGQPAPPSVLQQEYNSNLIRTLRANGGSSAYVPTTTVYSGFFDEIVEPQQGSGASAFLQDIRNVGVTNNEVQLVCPTGSLGGSFYTHEGILYNPLGFALAIDALKHDGPGQASRLNLASVCSTFLTKGLDLEDFLLTENSILVAGYEILTYPTPVTVEPPIKSKLIHAWEVDLLCLT